MPQSIKRRREIVTAEQPSLWSYIAPTMSNHWGIPRAVRTGMEPIPKPRKKGKRMAADPIAAHDRHLRRTYGITAAEYEVMLAAQGGVCAICGQPERAIGGRHGTTPIRLSVDHDHETGRVRALLCDNCNAAIGGFRDNTDVMLKAIGYVRQHKQAS